MAKQKNDLTLKEKDNSFLNLKLISFCIDFNHYKDYPVQQRIIYTVF
jgi:hypothetical protein